MSINKGTGVIKRETETDLLTARLSELGRRHAGRGSSAKG